MLLALRTLGLPLYKQEIPQSYPMLVDLLASMGFHSGHKHYHSDVSRVAEIFLKMTQGTSFSYMITMLHAFRNLCFYSV